MQLCFTNYSTISILLFEFFCMFLFNFHYIHAWIHYCSSSAEQQKTFWLNSLFVWIEKVPSFSLRSDQARKNVRWKSVIVSCDVLWTYLRVQSWAHVSAFHGKGVKLFAFFPPRHQGKHCLLEAELSCVKDLLRREIYPIIIYVKICERNVKKLR